ncbi:MAG: PIN domain-containing protein [Candidatus Levybacteria bacterium]|nr:PIN domain-containing protein [Candidatus Levybacteria bacterium]
MIRVFIDSSVLFSACFSKKGASREIILNGIRGELELVISDYVKEEAERNLKEKAPEALPYLQQVLEAIPFKIAKPTLNEIERAALYVEIEDAPIVAGAKYAKADYLVSLDRKHLAGVVDATKSGIKTVLPAQLLKELRQAKN